MGNLFASINGPLQTRLAERHHDNYAGALAGVIVVVLPCVALITTLGREARGRRFID